MRVLAIGTDYPPAAAGGYELQCHATLEHLRARGHEVRVLTSAAPVSARELADGVHRELRRFPSAPRPTGRRQAWLAERRNARVLARHLRDLRPHAVSLWRLGELSMSLASRVGEAGVPALGVVCDPWMLDGPRRDPWARRRGAGVALGAARWVCASRSLRGSLRAAGLDLGGAPVVTPGVDLDALPLAPARPWRGRLLYAGRLSALKGVDTAVAALAHLGPGHTLDLVGAGAPAYVEELRRLAERLGVAHRVRLRGPAGPPDMAAAYADADAVLFPVRWDEPWGLVPLEAMAVGRPVVATGTGGSAEYLRGDANCLLVPPDAAEPLAGAVRRLAADADLRARLRVEGRRTAERHAAADSCARIADLLEELAGEKSRAPADWPAAVAG